MAARTETPLQAKGHQGLPEPPEAWREMENGLSFRVLEGADAVDTLILDFWPPEQHENTFLLFEAPGCGVLLQPQEAGGDAKPTPPSSLRPRTVWYDRCTGPGSGVC